MPHCQIGAVKDHQNLRQVPTGKKSKQRKKKTLQKDYTGSKRKKKAGIKEEKAAIEK